MSGDEVPNLPGDVADLLASGRRIVGPADDVRARLRARLTPTIPVPPSGQGGARSNGDDGGVRGGRSPASWARAPWWAVAAALVVGAGAGRLTTTAATTTATGVPARAAPSAETRAGQESIAVSALADVALPAATESGPASVPAAGSLPARTTTGAGAVKASGDLGSERRLLDVARTALGRENGDDALAACDEHGRRFPHGLLAEEREGIAVQALVESRRLAEARARGERFRQTYPKSILLPAVLAAIEANP